ncbi:hypothetical protein AVEN_219352-1 [Araneus ventricosus]|uniref:Tc1-like transposase DDE domain-containing protein n=1 Tax=Araneus ventricosus TaxID=182803 RepID=A0A4Y2BHC2_ARAVE|nr:hypothetical protein AVEN_219352-1 [Araneus ventricosus]
MDNASYHYAYAEKIPSTKTKKADTVAWLLIENIPHNATETRPELLNIVKKHKEKYRAYELDQIVYEMRHQVNKDTPKEVVMAIIPQMIDICVVNIWRAHQSANPNNKLLLLDFRRRIVLFYLSKEIGSVPKRRGPQQRYTD